MNHFLSLETFRDVTLERFNETFFHTLYFMIFTEFYHFFILHPCIDASIEHLYEASFLFLETLFFMFFCVSKQMHITIDLFFSEQ